MYVYQILKEHAKVTLENSTSLSRVHVSMPMLMVDMKIFRLHATYNSAVAFQKRYDASKVVPQPLNAGFWHCFDFYPTPKCDTVDAEHHCSSSWDDVPTFSPMIN